MSAAQIQIEMLEVCLDTKTVLRNCEKCEKCGVEFESVKRQRFCSNACRQAAYRESPNYQERVRRRKAATLRRKLDRRPYRYMSFDGRTAGPYKGSDKCVKVQPDRGDLDPDGFPYRRDLKRHASAKALDQQVSTAATADLRIAVPGKTG